mmetsp:Transcript_44838/g.77352  ORF Transcript_44838/g.77352 Transcript_44838/m.77352 type:complete len:182 (+) Transcript_44838:478-1023(+)
MGVPKMSISQLEVALGWRCVTKIDGYETKNACSCSTILHGGSFLFKAVVAVTIKGAALHGRFQHDIGEILEYYTQYQELMMHWNQLQTSTDVIGNILEVPYEHMATHFEQSLANLLYHLRLDFEPELLNFHITNIGHTIDTASHWQVAVPVYNGSVSRWKMFEKQLKIELEGTTFEHFLAE